MGPLKPPLTRSGSRPQWSRCAWVRTTASSVAGSNPNGIRLRTDSLGLPWNMPQSIRTRARSVSRRNWEPVTVVAPPRKWICMAVMVTARTPSGGEDERVDGDREEQQRQVADRVLVKLDRPLRRGLLRGTAPPQRVGLPDEDGAEADGRAKVDQPHPGDRPEQQGDRDHQQRVEGDLPGRLGDAAHDGEHGNAGRGVVLADPQRERP